MHSIEPRLKKFIGRAFPEPPSYKKRSHKRKFPTTPTACVALHSLNNTSGSSICDSVMLCSIGARVRES